jgi:hypothetical protein
MVKQIVLPRLSLTFGFSGEENSETITMFPSLLYFSVERNTKLTDICLASRALFPAKGGHKECSLATSHGDRPNIIVFTRVFIVIGDERWEWKWVETRERAVAIPSPVGSRRGPPTIIEISKTLINISTG